MILVLYICAVIATIALLGIAKSLISINGNLEDIAQGLTEMNMKAE